MVHIVLPRWHHTQCHIHQVLVCCRCRRKGLLLSHCFEFDNLFVNFPGVPNWRKVNSGLIKMYHDDVLLKFPVAQHFYFGTLLNFEVIESGEFWRCFFSRRTLWAENQMNVYAGDFFVLWAWLIWALGWRGACESMHVGKWAMGYPDVLRTGGGGDRGK